MPYPLTDNDIYQLNNDILPAFTRMKMGDHLGGVGQNPSGGADFFVDGNKSDDLGDGLSWASAKKLLASAITLANTYESTSANRAWAKRQRIHCTGDTLAEDLAILPRKCDIIGYGSHNANPMCCLEGVHAITTVSAGTRFINMRLKIKSAGGDIFTAGNNIVSGLEFRACVFDAHEATKAGGAIILGTTVNTRILGCRFEGAFSDAVIEIGTGHSPDMIIADNIIEGANAGIEINSGFTTTQWKSFILRNTIYTGTECINDAADKFAIIGNMAVTEQAKGAGGAGAIVGNEFLSAGNKIAASDLANADWPALGTL